MQNIKVAKLFGIEVYINYSWFFIFFLVTVTLAFGVFPTQYPQQTFSINILLGLITSALFFTSILFHEFMHSLVANLNKIPIKKITLFIFGGMSQMNEEPKTPGSEFKMAVAGPLSSFFLAGLFFSVYLGLKNLGLTTAFYAAFFWLGEINFFLAAFNLAPGFPLDGGRILRAAVWYFSHNYRTATTVAARAGQGVAFLLIFFGLLLFLAGNLGGLWLVLIGWFLNQSAVASYQQMILTQALADVHVKEIMSKEVKTVPPNLTLNQLIDDYFLKERYSRFPVVADGHILGVVTLNDVKNVPRDKWTTTKAVEVIEPLKKEMFMKPDDQAVKALMKMASEDVSHLLVVTDKDQLVGLVTRTDIIKLIKIKTTLGGY